MCVQKIDMDYYSQEFFQIWIMQIILFIGINQFQNFLVFSCRTSWKLILFSDINIIFLISWKIFTKSLRGLLDKPRKRDRSDSPKKGLKELIMDNICDLVNTLICIVFHSLQILKPAERKPKYSYGSIGGRPAQPAT